MLNNFIRFFPIYLIHRVLGKITHFYLFMHLYGFLDFIKRREIPKLLIQFFLIFIIPLSVSIYLQDLEGIKRALIVATGGFYAVYLARMYTQKDILLLLKVIIIYCLLDFIMQYLFHIAGLPGEGNRKYFPGGFSIYRLDGPQGYASHSAATILAAFLYFLIHKKRGWALLAFFTLCCTLSRSAIVFALFGSLLSILYVYREKLTSRFMDFVFFATLMSPYLIKVSEHFLTMSQSFFANTYTSDRYFIYLSYMRMSKDFFWGLGVDQAHHQFYKYIWTGSKVAESGIYWQVFTDQGPHNTFIKVLCDHGVLSYLLFCAFLTSAYRSLKKYDPKYCLFFITVLLNFLFVEGLSEWSFYFLISVVLTAIPATSYLTNQPRGN